jgi:GntR family transcriptional regulator
MMAALVHPLLEIEPQAVLDKHLPEPYYQQIVRWMVAAIDTGQWPDHYKLPAEDDLARALAVSRGTVRRALQEMISLRRLKQIQGQGTFVAAGGRVEQRLADQLITVSEELASAAIPYETEVLAQAVTQPPQRVGSMLALRRGQPVFALKRLRKVAGKPLILFHNYVVFDRCPEIAQVDFTRYRLFDVLERMFGLVLDWGSRTFEAQAATAEIAACLAIAPGDPVLYLEQVVYLNDGAPIEMSDVWFRGDSFRLSANLKRRGQTPLPNSSLELIDGAPVDAFG